MKTFEEYINEARQDYIFGGTDDRNTDVGATFDELHEGNKIYFCTVDFDGRIEGKESVIIGKFVSLKQYKTYYKLKFSYTIDHNAKVGFNLKHNCYIRNFKIHKRNLNSTVENNVISTGDTGKKAYDIIGTNLNDLLTELKKYVKVNSDVEVARKFFEDIQ